MPELQQFTVVLTGPSGAGKNYKIKAMMACDDSLGMPISATTRVPRPGEQHGVDYYFMTREEFISLREAGGFLEWVENHGNLYGTPREAIKMVHDLGQDALFDVDVRGARSIKAMMPEAITVFLYAPVSQLERQLRERGKDSESAIEERLAKAQSELDQCCDFDYVIVNDDYERADVELREIIRVARLRTYHSDHSWHKLHAMTLLPERA